MNNNDLRLGLKSLKVKYHGRDVGILAMTNNKKVAFSYAKNLKNEDIFYLDRSSICE